MTPRSLSEPEESAEMHRPRLREAAPGTNECIRRLGDTHWPRSYQLPAASFLSGPELSARLLVMGRWRLLVQDGWHGSQLDEVEAVGRGARLRPQK